MEGVIKNLQAEPHFYDSLEGVLMFSMRYPDMVLHIKQKECEEELPHSVFDCGFFKNIDFQPS